MNKEIIYIGDPMCSWCYGFSEVIHAIRARHADQVPVRLVMGGLRPDGTHVVTDEYRNFLRGHWQEIQARTGQPFGLGILERTGWIYDTEKACRAAVAARRFGAGMDWLVFAATQRGFYAHNHDPNDRGSYAAIAQDVGLDREAFVAAYDDPRTIAETQRDFDWARSIGVSAFPTVVLRDGDVLRALTVGYQPLQALAWRVEEWLAA